MALHVIMRRVASPVACGRLPSPLVHRCYILSQPHSTNPTQPVRCLLPFSSASQWRGPSHVPSSTSAAFFRLPQRPLGSSSHFSSASASSPSPSPAAKAVPSAYDSSQRSSSPLTSTPNSEHPSLPASSEAKALPPKLAALSAELASMPPPLPPPPSSLSSRFARPFNTAMAEYPLHLIASLAVFEVISFNVTHSLLLYSGVHFSSTLALAYLISVPVRKSAAPKVALGLPLGVVFATIFPWFKEIRITELRKNPLVGKAWSRLVSLLTSKTSASTPLSTPLASEALTHTAAVGGALSVSPEAAARAPAAKRRWWNPIRWTAYLARQTDRYGLALFIGYRLAGAVIILAIYYLLEWGVPIRELEHYASYFGYNRDSRVVGKASEYAGALVCSAALFPIALMLAPLLARLLHKVTSTIFRTKRLPSSNPS